MLCPYCQTDNRDDREQCYHCRRDLTMLRVIVNKAKHHYNQALEFAERDRVDDAIHELQNTLDLDASLVNAHVVLGTLYARKEMFAEARECWQRALAVDHRMLKAHQYLEKAERAEVIFPAMRRLRAAIGGLAAAVALLAVGWGATTYMMAGGPAPVEATPVVTADEPNPSATPAPFIPELDEQLDTGVAYAQVQGYLARKDLDAGTRKLLHNISETIRRSWGELESLAERSLAEGEPLAALEAARRLEERQPAEPYLGRARQIANRALAGLVAEVELLAEQVEKGEASAGQLNAAIAGLRAHAPENWDGRARIEALEARAGEAESRRVLAEAQAAATEAPAAEATRNLVELRARHPELTESINEMLGARLERELTQHIAETEGLLTEGSPEAARQRLGQLEEIYGQAGISLPQERLAELAGRIGDVERQAARAEVREYYEQKQWEQFLTASADLDALAADPELRAELERMRQEATDQYAHELYRWMHAQEYQFEAQMISPETAARVVENYEMVNEHMPAGLSRAAVMFYAASSHFKLGQHEPARELIGQIREQYPRSYIQSPLRRFIATHGEALGLKP